MEKFTRHQGVAAPLLQTNIDTDAIIPSREMKRVSKQGLGEGLFAAWRYTLPGGRQPDPAFILNQASYAQTSIILAGANFGCGSSREHAVWALKEYGIRALIAPSFGSIFYNNCIRNGILPIVLADETIRVLATFVAQNPPHHQLTIDLPAQSVAVVEGAVKGAVKDRHFYYELDTAHKNMLLNGLDSIALTETLNDKITAFEQQDKVERPWIYL